MQKPIPVPIKLVSPPIENISYAFHLKTWGGFYNKEYQKIHGYKEGEYRFYTEEERTDYINTLKETADRLNARVLICDTTEGFACNTRIVLHRVIKYKKEFYYSRLDIGVISSYESAVHQLHFKWLLGVNDFPLGENFNYTFRHNNEDSIQLIEEWITGAFKIS